MAVLKDAFEKAGLKLERLPNRPHKLDTRPSAEVYGELFANENSRRFVLHLIRAFGGHQAQHVEKWEHLGKYWCDVCGRGALDKETAEKFIKRYFEDSKFKDERLAKTRDGALEEALGHKGLAYTSENSRSVVCDKCFVGLMEWAKTMICNKEVARAVEYLALNHGGKR